ncbi:MAG: SUF system NifU family Fe-S cluster assembly protein [Spirochaetales bacterium]|nr:SUF system NifU family Fe-S cluster assembly protein [Spirochaetales bacterium]
MIGQLDELYQEIILDHYRNPRGAARLDHVPESRVHENPTCGDAVKLEVPIEADGTLGAVRFEGKGCAISTASASLMTERMSGRPAVEARAEAERFIAVMRGTEDPGILEGWGDLACLKGVIRYPLRVKCATLVWHALVDALSAPAG